MFNQAPENIAVQSERQSNLYEIISRLNECEHRAKYLNERLMAKNRQMLVLPETPGNGAGPSGNDVKRASPLILELLDTVLRLENALSILSETVTVTETI